MKFASKVQVFKNDKPIKNKNLKAEITKLYPTELLTNRKLKLQVFYKQLSFLHIHKL